MPGLHFEEFRTGREYRTAVRRVTDADIAAFAEVSGDRNPLHLDEAYAARSIFGGRIAHGLLGLSVASGLLNQLKLTEGTLLAFLGLQWDFRRPLRPGDEIGARIRVGATRRARDPSRGVVRLEVAVVNQIGETVQEGEFVLLVRARAQ